MFVAEVVEQINNKNTHTRAPINSTLTHALILTLHRHTRAHSSSERWVVEVEVVILAQGRRRRTTLLQRNVYLFGWMEDLIGARAGALAVQEWSWSGLQLHWTSTRSSHGRYRYPLRDRLLWTLLFFWFIIGIWIIPIMVPQRYVWFCLSFLCVYWSVQVLVHEVVLRRLLADVVTARWHADQVNLGHKYQFLILINMCLNSYGNRDWRFWSTLLDFFLNPYKLLDMKMTQS